MHVVLLPGLDGTGDLFGPLAEALSVSAEVTVVRYPKDECLDWDGLLGIADAAIPDGQPITLVAESFSGPLAILLASRRSLDIRRLVLCCSFAKSPFPRWFSWLPVPGIFAASLPRFLVRHLMSGRDSSPELVSAIQKCVKSVSPAVLASRMRMVLSVDVLQDLQRLSIPLLYLAGNRDQIIPGRAWKQIESCIPQSTLVTLDGPHLLLQREPKAAADEIVKFSGGQ